MALRSLLTTAERGQVLEIPTGTEDLAAHYTLSEADMSLIRQRRADANRLGFAIQLCLLRHPSIALTDDTEVPTEMIDWVSARLAIPAEAWDEYGTRGETRQEHGREIRAYLSLSAFGIADFRQLVEHVGEVAAQTDKGIVLVEGARDFLRSRKIASPGIGIIERACAQALTRANQRIYAILGDQLSVEHQGRLDGLLLRRADSSLTQIGWLRQTTTRLSTSSPSSPTVRSTS